jgi:hypothetical protein
LQQNEGNNAAPQQNVIAAMQNRFAGLGNLVLASLLRRG